MINHKLSGTKPERMGLRFMPKTGTGESVGSLKETCNPTFSKSRKLTYHYTDLANLMREW